MLTTATTATVLRSSIVRPALHPIATLRIATCPFSTSSSTNRFNSSSPFCLSPRHARPAKPLAPFSTKSTSCRHTLTPTALLAARARPYSSNTPNPTPNPKSTQSSPTARADARAAAQAAAEQQVPMDWNTFFALRKSRRRLQLAFSIFTTLAGCTVGALVITIPPVQAFITSLIPLEPFLTLGLATFACGALGWLLGPAAGSAVFNALKRKDHAQMVIKENQFFARIKKHRVDPSSSSTSNPVPDYYGEKISSVAGYRQWLKDQRAFNKKRTTFV